MNEQQIQRYGRQILLREVGGRGQTKLLSRPVRFDVSSPALSVAAAYLAAGGTRVSQAPGVAFDGFLLGTTVEAFNPDAGEAAAPWLTVRAEIGEGLQVVVGAELVWGSCPACLRLNHHPGAPAEGHDVTLGGLLALVIQRLALDLGEPLGVVQLRDGVPATGVPQRCADHPET
jgi:hypothetical protein